MNIDLISCPTCELNGDVHKVKYEVKSETLFVCYECGFLWDEDKSPLPYSMDKYFEENNINQKFEDAFEEIE